MPQPALHLLIGRRKLARWAAAGAAPFDLDDSAAVNAFLHGTLAPDMGNFPGGDRALARAVHTRRTDHVARALVDGARTPAETAFAWGWLSHVIADAEIHPLVNAAAAARSGPSFPLTEHVRVEVGLDVRFCCDDPLLTDVRLRPAFDRRGYSFLRQVLAELVEVSVSTTQLLRMERGLMLFSHAALDFARGAARRLCWLEEGPAPTAVSLVVWHAATRLSRHDSVVHAYLKPYVPDRALVTSTSAAIDRVHARFHHYVRAGLADLPATNLEDGTPLQPARSVA